MTALWGASPMTVLWGASPMTVLWDTTPYDGYMGSPLYYGLRTLNRNTRVGMATLGPALRVHQAPLLSYINPSKGPLVHNSPRP
jgi:hypothetical protein